MQTVELLQETAPLPHLHSTNPIVTHDIPESQGALLQSVTTITPKGQPLLTTDASEQCYATPHTRCKALQPTNLFYLNNVPCCDDATPTTSLQCEMPSTDATMAESNDVSVNFNVDDTHTLAVDKDNFSYKNSNDAPSSAW